MCRMYYNSILLQTGFSACFYFYEKIAVIIECDTVTDMAVSGTFFIQGMSNCMKASEYLYVR